MSTPPPPLFLMRTWAGGYVEPARWHLALLGWCRYWLDRARGPSW